MIEGNEGNQGLDNIVDYDSDTVVMVKRQCEGLKLEKEGVKIIKSLAHFYMAFQEEKCDSVCSTHKHIAESYLKLGYKLK